MAQDVGAFMVRSLSLGVVTLGYGLGVVDVAAVEQGPLALLCLVLGAALTFAFRSNPGPFCRSWQAHRRAGPHVLFVAYRDSGPWVLRFGLGLVLGLGSRWALIGVS